MKILRLVSLLLFAAHCDKSPEGAATSAPTTPTTSAPTASAPSAQPQAATPTGPFEGEVTMVETIGAKSKTLIFGIKGSKIRVVMPGGVFNGYVVYDAPAKQISTVDESDKSVLLMKWTLPTASKSAPVNTGKTDTILGYPCEIWTSTEQNELRQTPPSGNKTEVCLARGILGAGMSFPSSNGSPTWMLSIGDAFPLRAVTTDATGAIKSRNEVTKIERKALDDSGFAAPAGYKPLSL